MKDAQVGTDEPRGPEEDKLHVVKEDIKVAGVTTEDTDGRVKQRQMIGCGHPNEEEL